MLKAYKKAEQEMNKKRRSRNALSNWTDFTGKYEAMKCGSWLAADDGIRTFNKDYDNEVIVCYHPILPIGRLKNLETGEEQIKLAYKRNHRWTEITVPKDIISSASKIVSLSKLGVSVTSENAKLLVKYLSDVENLNDNDIPLQKSTSKLGWIGGDFIPYDTDILFDGDLQFKQLYESIRQQGSYMEWLNHVCGLRKRDRMEIKFFLAASFAFFSFSSFFHVIPPFTYVKCIFKVFGKLDNYSCPIVYCCLITYKWGLCLLLLFKKE